MKKFLFYIVNICLIVSLLIPSGLVQGMMKLASSSIESSGLYRTRVTIDQPYDLTRLQDLGIKVLDQESSWASVLVSDAQLENLARLGFEPQASNELGLLVSANAESYSWLASSLSAPLDQAISFMNSVENVQINGTEANDSTLVSIIEEFSLEQLNGIQALPGIDNDADGLTDTQEAWWCTDPMNAYSREDPDQIGSGENTDGEYVSRLLQYVFQTELGDRRLGQPFAGWPMIPGDGHFDPNCLDADFDGVPDRVELFVFGTNPNSESTSRDRYDDGQKLFGLTPPNWGVLPRAQDGEHGTTEMPGYVRWPGRSLFSSAIAYPEINITPGSTFNVAAVTTITTDHTISSGTENSYSLASSEGTSTSLSDTTTWNNWQEISESDEERIIGPNTSTLPLSSENSSLSFKSIIMNKKLDGVAKVGGWILGNAVAKIGCTNKSTSREVGVSVEVVKVGVGTSSSLDSEYTNNRCKNSIGLAEEICPTCNFIFSNDKNKHEAGQPQSFDPNIINNNNVVFTNNGMDLNSIASGIEGLRYSIDGAGQLIGERLYELSSIIASPVHTTTETSGKAFGGSQTTTTENFQEQTVTNGQAFSNSEAWSTATAIDSAHTADLWFSYDIINTGSDFAGSIANITFNIYLGDDPNPIYTYYAAEDIGGEGEMYNLMPGERHTFTSHHIPLNLDQMRDIDLGEPLRIILEDFSFAVEELFFQDAMFSGLQIAIDDGIEDGNQELDYYFLPTWGGDETVVDVLRRFFPISLDSDGAMVDIWTPEFHADTPLWCREPKTFSSGGQTSVWCKHSISSSDWWNIYTSGLGNINIGLEMITAIPGSMVLFRFYTDSDNDGYSDASEREFGTDENNSSDYPKAELVGGLHNIRNGNNVTSTLSLLNTGLYDAYGVEAIMVAPDNTITIDHNTVGGSGRVMGQNRVVVGSIIDPPQLSATYWSGSAKPISDGYYSGSEDRIYTFTVSCVTTGGCDIGSGDWSLVWDDGTGNSGEVNFADAYLSPDLVDIGAYGLKLGFISGRVFNGDNFSVSANSPIDTFKYVINQEPYTEPIVILSYNSSQGNKRIVLPSTTMNLSSPMESLVEHKDEMIKNLEIQITTDSVFTEGVNVANLVINNPTTHQLINSKLFLSIINSNGNVVLEKSETMTIPEGPSIVPVQWTTMEFLPFFDPDEEYYVLAYWTDLQGNILDTAGRLLYSFQVDPKATIESNLIDDGWNFGQVIQGNFISTDLVVSNSGFDRLSVYVEEGVPELIYEERRSHEILPGEMEIVELTLDTALLPLGSYNGSLILRTNDIDNSIVEIDIAGTIITPSEPITASADAYQPLNELLYVNGPIAANTITTYNNAAEVTAGVEPIVFTGDSGTILGKGEQFIDLENSSIPMTVPGTGSTVYDLASGNLDLTGAIELEEYRTGYSRMYVWPDGRGVVIPVSTAGADGNQLNDSASAGRYYDTYVNSYYPNTPTWDQAALYVGDFSAAYKTDARILLWFHLPTLPQYAVIDSATFSLQSYSWQGTDTINTQVFRITGSWSQTSTSPTWNNHPPVDWGTIWSSLNLPKATGSRSWNITELTRAWYSGTPNYGLVIRANPQGANGVVFRSHESGMDVPQLYVTFHIPPPPNAPTLYTISNTDGDGAYSVDWSDVDNTTSYNLEESFNSGAWNLIMNTASSIYNASGRSAGLWCYRVMANNAYGSSGWSATQCTTVNPPPGTPAIATIDNADGDGNYLVDWNDVPLAISYELQENHDAGAFTTIYSGASSAFTITGRNSGQWCYRAKAINPSGSSGWSSTQCTIVNTPPVVPIAIMPIDAASQLGRVVTFSWQESSDPDNYPGTPLKYHVEVSSLTSEGSQVSEWTTNSQITMVVPEDGEFSWRVEASDNISNSGWSASRTFVDFSIVRADAERVSIALPETIDTFTNYKVFYGLPASFPAAITPTMVYVELPKRLYSSVTLNVLVNESVNQNATLTIDVAANGSIEWSQDVVWNSPTFFESPDLTIAINDFMTQSSSAGGELVSVPVSVNYSSVGELFITGIEAHTGVDSDPQLSTGDLMVSNTNPMETDVINLTARVFNAGIFTAKNIMVNYFVGNPAEGGRYIGSKLVSSILAGSYVDAVLNWDTSGYVGNQEVYAAVDYSSQIPEIDETNNITSQSLTIRTRPDLSISLISLSDFEPVVGESVTLTISETNLGESDAASSLVSAYVGDPQDGGVLLGENLVEIMRGSTTSVNFTWTPDRTGWYRLHVFSDTNSQVSEYDESNNQNWLDVYVGLAGPLLLDSGTSLDPIYSVETGYGYIDVNQPDELVSCSINNLPEETLRRDPDGTVVYQFDHLLPGHFYHLDITLFECDGAGRQETILVDGNQISEVEDLGDGQVHRLSLRLDPALYADRNILVEIQAEGIDGAVVSEVNLHDIDYRYADSGGNRDPQYPGDQGYGWIDGSPVLTWGTLPYQSVRVDQSDDTLNYQFDNLSPTKLYNVHFTFWQPSGTGRIQKVQVDGIDTGLSINTGDHLRHQEKISIPLSVYSSDGRVVISIVRTNAITGAMVNEIALEEETVFTGTSCVVQPTPYFTESYGSVLISGVNAPVGSIVQAFNPRGDTVGCFTVTDEGLYGFMRIYGEDSSANPPIPGMRAGEIVGYSVNGAPAVASPLFYWSDDHAVHNINLNAGNVSGQSILLKPGWNLISFNVEPPAPIVSSVLQSIASRYDRVLGENGIYVPSLPAEFNTLKELHSATGYYLRVTGSTSVSLLVEGIAQACSEPKELHTGWNWIGAPCDVIETATALASIDGHYQRVLSLDKTYDPALPMFSTLKNLIPGEGYLIYITDPVTLIYPDGVTNTDEVQNVVESACRNVPSTPFSTLVYGYLYVNSELAQEGTLVEFVTPRGEVAGCSLIAAGGMLPLTQIYGADGENIGGFLADDQILVRVNGIVISQQLEFTWQDDKTPHELSINTTMHKINLPLITH